MHIYPTKRVSPAVVNAKGFGGSLSSLSVINTTVKYGEKGRKRVIQFYTYMNIYLINTCVTITIGTVLRHKPGNPKTAL